jgi:hypothetical protein
MRLGALGRRAGAAVACLLVAGCGTAAHQRARAPATIPVAVTQASWPASQRLAEATRLVISVRNLGRRPLPDVAVTITNPADGTGAAAFASSMPGPGLASHSRPVWIVDQAPGACGFSCRAGGAGGASTEDADTWALGALRPGATATFRWRLTAVKAGTYRVRYRIAADLRGAAVRAALPDGAPPAGTLTATIQAAPTASYITPSGRVTTTP